AQSEQPSRLFVETARHTLEPGDFLARSSSAHARAQRPEQLALQLARVDELLAHLERSATYPAELLGVLQTERHLLELGLCALALAGEPLLHVPHAQEVLDAYEQLEAVDGLEQEVVGA